MLAAAAEWREKKSTNDFAPNTTTVSVYTLRIDLSICTQLTSLSLRKMFTSFIFRPFELPQNWTAALFFLYWFVTALFYWSAATQRISVFSLLFFCKVFFDTQYSLDAIKFDWTNQKERKKTRRIFSYMQQKKMFYYNSTHNQNRPKIFCYIIYFREFWNKTRAYLEWTERMRIV